MKLDFFFPDIERHEIDGREIIIEFKTQVKLRKECVDSILEACSKSEMAKHFPSLRFIIQDNSGVFDLAHISFRDYKRNHDNIVNVNSNVFNPGSNSLEDFRNELEDSIKLLESLKVYEEMDQTIIERDISNLKKLLDELPWASNALDQLMDPFRKLFGHVIEHEIAHLWHNTRSKVIKKYINEAGSILSAFGKNEKNPEVRLLLTQLKNIILIEGIALYAEESYKGKIFFGDGPFAEYYLQTMSAAANAVTALKDGMNKGTLTIGESKTVVDWAYKLGLHMVYTVLYLNRKLSLDDLAKMKPVKFIELYELSMLKKKMTPVFSYNTGAGFIDYAKILKAYQNILKSNNDISSNTNINNTVRA